MQHFRNLVTKPFRGKSGLGLPDPQRGVEAEKVMTYRECLELLEGVGVWAPERPGPRSLTLRWGNNRDGEPIRGIYLNATDAGQAYFTLLRNCQLKPDETLWPALPIELTPENDAGKWNISPQVGRERDALRQLFGLQDLQ